MERRAFLTAVVWGALLGMVLVACAAPASPMLTPVVSTPPPLPATAAPIPTPLCPTSTHLTLWHGDSGPLETFLHAELERFSAQYPCVQVEARRIDLLLPTLEQVSGTQQAPDIVVIPHDQIGLLASAGHIVALDAWIDQADLAAQFEPAAAAAVVWRDQLWGLPASQDAIALVYNPALVDPQTLPEPDDFEALSEAAAAFVEERPDHWYLCNPGFDGSDLGSVAPVYYGFGAFYVDASGAVGLDTSQGVAAARWLSEIRPLSPPQTDMGSCLDAFAQGRLAAVWTGSWLIPRLAGAGLDYGVWPMGSPLVDVGVWALTPAALQREHAEVALEVLRWWTSADEQKWIALATHVVPASSAALSDPQVQTDPLVRRFGEAARRGVPSPDARWMFVLNVPVGEATRAVWEGTLSPARAMEQAQRAAVEAIENVPVE